MVVKKPNFGYINHIAFVADASTSMQPVAKQLVKVADEQVKFLAQRSTELDQETRVSFYTFADRVQCAVYDKDVLRLPSIGDFYEANGWTALIDGTMQAIEELEKTATLHGDHAFLVYVLTDGAENVSRRFTAAGLTAKLKSLPENWTVATLVPDQTAVFSAKQFGFPAENISVWDATTVKGVSEGGNKIREATNSYMTARATGTFRGTKNLFAGTSVLNTAAVQAANLDPMATSAYMFLPVIGDCVIHDFVVNSHGLPWKTGQYYYQLVKAEKIQPNKDIALLEKKTMKVYNGQRARDLLGLGDVQVRVTPDTNREYAVFVQSTSNNRKLPSGTQLLVLK